MADSSNLFSLALAAPETTSNLWIKIICQSTQVLLYFYSNFSLAFFFYQFLICTVMSTRRRHSVHRSTQISFPPQDRLGCKRTNVNLMIKRFFLSSRASWYFALTLQVEHAFTNYGPGVKYVQFVHRGKDSQFWAGHYGVKLAAPSVKLTFPDLWSIGCMHCCRLFLNPFLERYIFPFRVVLLLIFDDFATNTIVWCKI